MPKVQHVSRKRVPRAAPTDTVQDVSLPDGALSLEALQKAAECLRTLAHPHRLRMLQLLLHGRYTVGELAQACGIASHVASEHLRLMQHCGFLSPERQGRRIYYVVQEPHLVDLMSCIEVRFGPDRPRPPTSVAPVRKKQKRSCHPVATS